MKKTVIGLFALSALLSASCFVSEGAAAKETECFVLREYGGKIALFSEPDELPITVYDMPLSGLYPADAELLREGIRLKTRAEVTSIIEDWGIEFG